MPFIDAKKLRLIVLVSILRKSNIHLCIYCNRMAQLSLFELTDLWPYFDIKCYKLLYLCEQSRKKLWKNDYYFARKNDVSFAICTRLFFPNFKIFFAWESKSITVLTATFGVQFAEHRLESASRTITAERQTYVNVYDQTTFQNDTVQFSLSDLFDILFSNIHNCYISSCEFYVYSCPDFSFLRNSWIITLVDDDTKQEEATYTSLKTHGLF